MTHFPAGFPPVHTEAVVVHKLTGHRGSQRFYCALKVTASLHRLEFANESQNKLRALKLRCNFTEVAICKHVSKSRAVKQKQEQHFCKFLSVLRSSLARLRMRGWDIG